MPSKQYETNNKSLLQKLLSPTLLFPFQCLTPCVTKSFQSPLW